MKWFYRFATCFLVIILFSDTAAFAGYWERKGMCATYEKTPAMRKTQKLAETQCTQIQASGTGVFQQDFKQGDEILFTVMADNYPETDHMEYRTRDGPAFYSDEELYDYQSCYITPRDNALIFHCFRADDE